jgi:hypothetical protein
LAVVNLKNEGGLVFEGNIQAEQMTPKKGKSKV